MKLTIGRSCGSVVDGTMGKW